MIVIESVCVFICNANEYAYSMYTVYIDLYLLLLLNMQ